jgi:hypothetical protein
VSGSCVHHDEPSGSTKRWEFLKRLSNWQLLKEGSAPWTLFVSYLFCFFVPLFARLQGILVVRISVTLQFHVATLLLMCWLYLNTVKWYDSHVMFG